jgi:hypothetical protein
VASILLNKYTWAALGCLPHMSYHCAVTMIITVFVQAIQSSLLDNICIKQDNIFFLFLFSAVCRICTDKHNKQLSIGMEIEDEIRGNNIKDEVRKLYLLERETAYEVQ